MRASVTTQKSEQDPEKRLAWLTEVLQLGPLRLVLVHESVFKLDMRRYMLPDQRGTRIRACREESW